MTTKERTVRVLGVDPGTRVVGYGVLDVARGKQPGLVVYGAIRLPAGEMALRLKMLHEELERLILTHRPKALAVETVFHGKSFDSVLKVGEARGVVLLAGAQHGLDIDQFTPAVVKKTATGNGRAAKSQVQSMMARMFGLDPVPEPPDITDALAIAFCYGQRAWRKTLSKKPSKWKQLLETSRTSRKPRARGRNA